MRWIILSLALACSTNGTPLEDGGAGAEAPELGRQRADAAPAEIRGADGSADAAAPDAASEPIVPADLPADGGAPDAAKDAPAAPDVAPEKPVDVRPESKCPAGADDGGCRQWCLCDEAACGATYVPYCGMICGTNC